LIKFILSFRNGEEWYRLRSAVQQMMMRPKEVTVYLPLVEQVVNDFIKHIKTVKNTRGEIHNFRLEAAKWNLECKFFNGSTVLFLVN
jgi:cytochrome P450